jgi:hypothetical protein
MKRRDGGRCEREKAEYRRGRVEEAIYRKESLVMKK